MDGPLTIPNQIEKEVEWLGADGDRLTGARKPVKAHVELEDIKSVERHSSASRPP